MNEETINALDEYVRAVELFAGFVAADSQNVKIKLGAKNVAETGKILRDALQEETI